VPPESVADILARNNAVLAPMAGINEAPFRAICKRLGAGLTYSEMVSATGLHYSFDSRKARQLLSFDPDETPLAVQLYGADPSVMAAQAARIMDRYGDDIALFDINMGCPVNKVVNRGEGAGLMRTPGLAAENVAAVVAAVDVPVTIKIRAGWDDDSRNAPEFAAAMAESGAAAVAVHGRTRGQQYRGRADWDVIAQVKRAVDVPVLGSGDIFTAQDAVDMLSRTGADGVMVARGAQGNPWIFREIRALIDTGEPLAPPSFEERLDLAAEHARAMVATYGDVAVPRMRKHVIWYTSGMPDAARVRVRTNSATSLAEMEAVLADYRTHLREVAP
jgi:nifR3 family TIM-barrel protein